MTVIVGFVGPDGAVMASDSEATEADYTRFDMAKMWSSGECLLGYSGNTSVRDPLTLSIEQTFERAGPDLDRWKSMAELCDATKAVIDPAYKNYVPEPAVGEVPQKLRGHLLVIGHDADGYWLLELNENNTPTLAPRGFHAIGSGSVAAQVASGLLAHYESHGRNLWHLKLIAYRTVATCINVLGGPYGIGGPVQLWESVEAGGFQELDEQALKDVEHGVEQWVTIERESLGKVSGKPESEEEEAAEVEAIPEKLE
jgi:hypothetical protein